MIKKEKTTRWLNGCPCGEKFALLAVEFSGNFPGEIIFYYFLKRQGKVLPLNEKIFIV